MATPAGRRWLLPMLVLLAWLVAAGVTGPLAASLSEVQQNDNAAYLPEGAESTRAMKVLTGFQDEESVPATVVFRRAGGLTEDDRAAIQRYADELAAVDGLLDDGVGEAVPSADGEAVQLRVDVAGSDGERVQEVLHRLRDVLVDPPDGLTVLVGGQGGIVADFVTAFGAIDGLLLLVALSVVLVILVVVYRTPVLPVVVLLSSVFGLVVASGLVYLLAKADLITVSGQSQGILFILEIGAATDYSLLLVARFREELRDRESKYDAMRAAYRASLEPIIASGTTVILGLLCLLISDLESLNGLGPVGAFGVAAAMVSSLTLLPAALMLLGRGAFWPFRPAFGSEHRDATSLWGKVARLIARHPRRVWAATFAALAIAAGFVTTLNEDSVPQTDTFLTAVDSVTAQDILDAHWEADEASPLQVVVPEADLPDAVALLTGHAGIVAPQPDGMPTVFPIPAGADPRVPMVVDGRAVVLATLADPAESQAAFDTVRALRTDLDQVNDEILVGGVTAVNLDFRDITDRDRSRVIPAILAVIFVVLALLLRALVAPLLLIVANVLSFGATLGISALLFQHVFGFPSTDPTISLIGFVFLVALGIDYSIFLMTRVREEVIRQGTHPGILKGLAVTGGVITSAGVVLAATFAALGVVPILFLAQIGFIVAFGVLLDTFVVRSLLVPAVSYDAGRVIWWPSRLSREPDHADAETDALIRG